MDLGSRVRGLAGRVSPVLTGTTCGQLCRPSWVQVSYMFQRGRSRPKAGATCLRTLGSVPQARKMPGFQDFRSSRQCLVPSHYTARWVGERAEVSSDEFLLLLQSTLCP